VRCLIVDDRKADRELVRDIVKQRMECTLAASRAEALRVVREAFDEGRPFDLAIVDVMMPDGDGHTLVDALRGLEGEYRVAKSARTPILHVTGLWNKNEFAKAYKEGVEHYVGKPIDPRRLLDEIEVLVGGGAADAGSGDLDRPARILIVDDDFKSCVLLTEILRPYGECDVAEGGEQAIQLYRGKWDDSAPYDLVFLDINMPYVDGHAVLQEIGQVQDRARSWPTKVVMVTGEFEPGQCVQSFQEGCEHFIGKPIDPAQLRAVLHELGWSPQDAPLPQVGAN